MFWCYAKEKWCSCWCCNREECEFENEEDRPKEADTEW